MVGMRFDTHARGKSVIEKSPMKNYFKKRALRASGLSVSKNQETFLFLKIQMNYVIKYVSYFTKKKMKMIQIYLTMELLL